MRGRQLYEVEKDISLFIIFFDGYHAWRIDIGTCEIRTLFELAQFRRANWIGLSKSDYA